MQYDKIEQYNSHLIRWLFTILTCYYCGQSVSYISRISVKQLYTTDYQAFSIFKNKTRNNLYIVLFFLSLPPISHLLTRIYFETIMAKAFLSHSSSDKYLVRKIANLLGNQRCVLDEKSFEPGARTLDEIFRELDESDVFVLFISDKALDSDWVQKELTLAYNAMNEDKLDRILPIIIDEKVDYTDPRIPKWLSKDYNLRCIKNEVIIFHKIRDALYDVAYKRSEHNQALERIFVGRNEEMAKFEKDINNIEGWTPTYIIAYNFYQGIGRSTFLKNALLT